MKRLDWAIAVVALSAGCGAGFADEAAGPARLAAERASIESRYSERARGCQEGFFVTACLDAAQKDRREALDRVRLEQQALDDAERKRRAAERLRRIHEKVGAQSAAAAATPPTLREPKQRLSVSPAASATPAAATASRAAQVHGQRSAEASRNAEAEQARLKKAAEHRAAVEKRKAERAAKRARATPLPASAPAGLQ